MKRKSFGLWIAAMVGILVVVISTATVVSAEEPEPARTEEPSETVDQSSTTAEESAPPTAKKQAPALGSGTRSSASGTESAPSSKRPRSLADLAGGIDLNSPQGEGTESIVITNKNLKTMGKGAVVTEGSNMGGTPSSSELWAPTPRGGEAPGEDDIEAARREVERLESQASALDQAVEENKAVNMYTGVGPQHRAPGQTDPLQNQQSNVNQQLSDARARLAEMEKAAAGQKRSGSTPAPPAPSSSAGGDGK